MSQYTCQSTGMLIYFLLYNIYKFLFHTLFYNLIDYKAIILKFK